MPTSGVWRYGKWLLALALGAVVLVVALLLALERVPVDVYRDQLVEQVESATGRDFRIDGDIELALFPYIGFRIGELHLANPPGATAPDLFAAEQVNVRLAVLPLLTGDVRVRYFVIEQPVVHLEIDAQGNPNWVFASGEPEVAEAPAPEETGEQEPFQLPDLEIGEVRLSGGRVTYLDTRTGDRYDVDGLELTTQIDGLEEPFAAELALVWNEEPVRLTIRTSPLEALNRGERLDAELAVESSPVALAYGGAAGLEGVDGRLELDVPSVRGLTSWLGSPLEGGEGVFGPLSLKTQLKAGPEAVSVTGAHLTLDDIAADFDVDVALAGEVPAITARLEAGRIDVDAYLPASDEAEAAEAEEPEPDDGAPPEWSREPIDYSGLRAVNADVTLRAGPVLASGITLDRAALKAVLEGGRLDFAIEEIALYEGSVKGRLKADGSGDELVVSPQLEIAKVAIGPLLRDAADLDRLSGTLAFSTALGTRGRSVYGLFKRLGGEGELSVRDGELIASPLLGLLTSVASPFESLSGLLSTAKTKDADFERIGGTFEIRRGVLTNRDLRMLGPGLDVSGAGTADLAERLVDYKVDGRIAKAVGTGVAVRGPWHDVKVRVAAQDVLDDAVGGIAAQAKDLGKETPRKVADELKKAKDDLLGSFRRGR